jgi:hypothetical protein
MSAALKIDLEELDAQDRRALYEQLHYEFQRDIDQADAPDTSRAMWNVVQSAIAKFKEEDEPSRQPMSPLRKKMGIKKFDQAMRDLDQFVEKSCGITLRRPQQIAVTEECLVCLAQYLKRIKVPVTPLTLIANVDKLAAAVDRGFPGYARAKLLHMVVLLKTDSKGR